MSANHVMIDLETLGTDPDAIVLSLGAVTFDPAGSTLYTKFHRFLTIEDQIRCGRKATGHTFLWWLKQNEAARAAQVQAPRLDLRTVFHEFSTWLPKDAVVWGNGSAFDVVLVREIYRDLHIPTPWAFWNERCYRTVKSMAPNVPLVRHGTAHDALDDAISQALHLQQICKTLQIQL